MAVNSNAFYEKMRFQEPQITLTCPTTKRMWLVCLCAFLAVIQSALTDSFSSLLLALSSIFAAVITEFLIRSNNEKTALLKNGSTLTTALVFTLLLPNRISPLYAAMGAIFAIAVVKHCFGGLGSNWLNPAAGGWLFVRLSWPGAFNRALEESPLSLLAEGVSHGITNPEGSPVGIIISHSNRLAIGNNIFVNHLSPFLNRTVFLWMRTELPDFYFSLLSSPSPGIIADRGILGLLIGSILIIAFRACRPFIPALWIFIFVFFTRLTGAFPYGAGWWKGDIFFTLCSGGTLAAALILAADPVTNAKSLRCILVTAIAGGFFAWLFRFPGAEAYGAIYSILLINALLLIVRNIESLKYYEKRRTL